MCLTALFIMAPDRKQSKYPSAETMAQHIAVMSKQQNTI